MVYAHDFGLTVIFNHCEDPSLAAGCMNEGANSTRMGGARRAVGGGRHHGGPGYSILAEYTRSAGTPGAHQHTKVPLK